MTFQAACPIVRGGRVLRWVTLWCERLIVHQEEPAMTPPLDLVHRLLLVTPLVLLDMTWFRMVVGRILITPQFAPATC